MSTERRPRAPFGHPWSDLTDDERLQVLDWVTQTCLLFGSQRSTAYAVASTFAEGLDSLIEERPARFLHRRSLE